MKSFNSLLLIAPLAFFFMRNIKKQCFSMAAFSFSASILHFIISWKASSEDWFDVTNDTITPLGSYEVRRCFFVPMRGFGGTSSFTNAGTSLEIALKGLWMASLVRGRGCGFGAKNWEALRIFSFSSKLFCLMASWISIASWYSTYNHTHSWSSSNRSSWSPGLLEEPH